MKLRTQTNIIHWIMIGSLLVGLLLVLLGLVSSAQSLAPMTTVVYEDALDSGWDNWSWNTTIDPANPSPVNSGTASLAVTYTTAWSGLYLHANALDLSTEDTLRFWLHGGAAGGQEISVSLNQNGYSYDVTATAGTWQRVEIPLSTFGSPATISDLIFQENNGGAQPTFYLDEVAFINNGLPTPTEAPSGVGPNLSVDVMADRHSISPYIYGMNFTDENLADELGLPVRRNGGNSTTRYNWQTDVHNTGSDWYFENIPGPNAYDSSLPDGSGADLFIDQNERTDTETIMTIPLIGWTPKSNPVADSHPFDCGFKVSVYGAQDSVDPWDVDCGNGLQGGTEITGNDPGDTSVAIDPSFVTGWINHLTNKYGTADNGGVMFYNLDNEPMIWSSTHRDIHPQPNSYDEMRDRTYSYAAAVKAADPNAQTLGPVVWGWCAYFYSDADGGCQDGPDRQAHGGIGFVEWYLQQMNLYEQQHGIRILDYVDVHSYPYASGVALSEAGNAETQALRLRSTRSLWDPTYLDESWVGRDLGQAVYSIRRMKQWVADYYPGTKTAITEYNWGAHEHINGALAQADVLGIFGREGLDLATLWGPPGIDQPAAYAFRMYLNYDGSGSGFGETAVQAASTDQDQLAIYAAQREEDEALTMMIINKTAQPLASAVSLAGFTPLPNAQVYRYSAEDLNAIVHPSDQPVTASGFTAAFPANSITLVILFPIDVPDLSPSGKIVNPPFADYGDTLTYTLQIINQGLPLTNTVYLTDTVPAGLSYVPGSLNASGGSVDDSNVPILYWTGALSPTQSVGITYAVTVTSQLSQAITNSAVISASGLPSMTRSAMIIVNGQELYLPLLMR